MYSYTWDEETGGLLLNSNTLQFSKEPRPVFYQELDILGFDKYWNYEKNDIYPYMWAEASNYFYRGRLVAKTKGGSLYSAPELVIIEEPEPNGEPLRFVDIPYMVEKNQNIMEILEQDAIKRIYNTYVEFKDKVDVFYVAFSGGKDSIVTLDLVQRALPHNDFKVLFGDTGMEFPDTYKCVDIVNKKCKENGISFYRASSKLTTDDTWRAFGPPAVTIRWCCSVHKTSPQIMLLQNITNKQGFTGMAFTGVRADESLARSEYSEVSFGEKHKGQYSCHPILSWGSAELFVYIFHHDLFFNDAYKKGNSRAGCLICPMSSGKHEYMKMQCYPKEVDKYVQFIKNSTGKDGFTDDEKRQFIDDGDWKTRKSGRELNLGYDQHIVDICDYGTKITVFLENEDWKEWSKTIGHLIHVDSNLYYLDYQDKSYEIKVKKTENGTEFSFPNCGNSKDDIQFISLFRSVITKSIYCVRCGICSANCSVGCIDMNSGISISDKCVHCHMCHKIHDGCVRYYSIKNRIGGTKKMKGMDRYFSFGIRKSWMDSYFRYEGSEEFWNSDGDGEVANKKKDAFLNFAKDCGLTHYDNTIIGNKYVRNLPSIFAKRLFLLGSNSEISWGLMLCNLAYTPELNWYIKNIRPNNIYTPESIKYMLEKVMEGDSKGLGKRNIIDAYKSIMIKTPLGEGLGLAHCKYDEKTNSNGSETLTLESMQRGSWKNPDPKVILYSLYKFAENCGNYYQFTLSRLLDFDVDSEGVSPAEIFGLDRITMEKLLTGLNVNYPDFITTHFNLDLDVITLNPDKTSTDVLDLF